MRKLRLFKCSVCNYEQERLVKDNIKKVSCKKCGSDAKRQISSARYLGNTVGKSPALKK